jgi:hypothetical protein
MLIPADLSSRMFADDYRGVAAIPPPVQATIGEKEADTLALRLLMSANKLPAEEAELKINEYIQDLRQSLPSNVTAEVLAKVHEYRAKMQ